VNEVWVNGHGPPPLWFLDRPAPLSAVFVVETKAPVDAPECRQPISRSPRRLQVAELSVKLVPESIVTFAPRSLSTAPRTQPSLPLNDDWLLTVAVARFEDAGRRLLLLWQYCCQKAAGFAWTVRVPFISRSRPGRHGKTLLMVAWLVYEGCKPVDGGEKPSLAMPPPSTEVLFGRTDAPVGRQELPLLLMAPPADGRRVCPVKAGARR